MIRNRIKLITTALGVLAATSLSPAQPPVGFKLAFGGWEMRDNSNNKLMPTLELLEELGVRNVMITVNQKQVMPNNSTSYDEDIFDGIEEALDFCDTNKIAVTIGIHQVFWNNGSDGFFPSWMGVNGNDKGAVLEWDGSQTNTKLENHIDFINEVIDRTKNEPAVIAYNVVNEPYYSVLDQPLRVAGTAKLLKDTKAHLNDTSIKIVTGMVAGHYDDHYPDRDYFMNTDHSDFPAAGQDYTAYKIYHKHAQKMGINNPLGIERSFLSGVNGLGSKKRWRTESGPYWKYYEKFSTANGGIGVPDTSVADTITYSYESGGTSEDVGEHVWFDYDFSQDYLLQSDDDPMIEKVYNWKIGRQSGSDGDLLSYLEYDSTGSSPVIVHGYPVFFGIVDLAVGIDSFESISPNQLPEKPSEQSSFTVNGTTRGFNERWSFSSGGTFTMSGDCADGSNQSPLTSMAAKAEFSSSGNYMERTLNPDFYEANGVSESSSLEFWIKVQNYSGSGNNLELILKQNIGSGETGFRHRLEKLNTGWTKVSIPLSQFTRFYGPYESLDISNLTKFRIKSLSGNFTARFDDIKFTYSDIN